MQLRLYLDEDASSRSLVRGLVRARRIFNAETQRREEVQLRMDTD
jgi:hypothetical protein